MVEKGQRSPLAALAKQASLTALTEELRESSTRLDALGTGESATDVRTVLASSYRALDPETARVFRQLVQAPGTDLAHPAAGSLTGLSPARTRTALDRLRAAHLLQEHVPGRFHSHDLLRTYALEVADSVDGAEGRAARIRLLDHYLHTAWSADRLLHPHRDPIRPAPAVDGVRPQDLTTHDEAMSWFAQEHTALVAAVRQAARHGHDTHAWQLAWALMTFLTRRGQWSDVATVHTTALAAAARLGDAAAQAESHRALAWERTEAGDHDGAHSRLTRALALARDSDQALSEAHTHLALGWLHEHTGDRPAALSLAARRRPAASGRREDGPGGRKTERGTARAGGHQTAAGRACPAGTSARPARRGLSVRGDVVEPVGDRPPRSLPVQEVVRPDQYRLTGRPPGGPAIL